MTKRVIAGDDGLPQRPVKGYIIPILVIDDLVLDAPVAESLSEESGSFLSKRLNSVPNYWVPLSALLDLLLKWKIYRLYE